MSNLFQSSIVRNTGKLLSANVIAQAIGILVYPVLTRLFSPSEFGVFNHYTSICGILVTVSTLELYNAIVLPKTDSEARNVVYVACIPLLIMVAILSMSIPFASSLTAFIRTPDICPIYYLLPLSVLLGGAWNILNYWYIRKKAYGRISGYQISQASFTSAYKMLFGFAGWTTFGLIISSVMAQICSLGVSIGLACKSRLLPLFDKSDKTESYTLSATWRKYSNFPKFSFPRSIINYFFGQLPVLVLTPLFGTEQIGFWGMALVLAFAPMSMITRSLYQSLYEHTSGCVNEHKHIAPYMFRFTKIALITAIPSFAILYFILPWLTTVLLGNQWETTGYYIRWMLPWLVCSLLTASTGFLADIFFKQKIGLYFEIFMAALRTAGVAAGCWCNNFEVAIAGYCIGSAIACGVQFVWLLSLVRRYEQSLE